LLITIINYNYTWQMRYLFNGHNELYHLFNDRFGFSYNRVTTRENCLREVEKHLSTEGNGGGEGEQEKSSCERDVALRHGAFYRATYRTRGGVAASENTKNPLSRDSAQRKLCDSGEQRVGGRVSKTRILNSVPSRVRRGLIYRILAPSLSRS